MRLLNRHSFVVKRKVSEDGYYNNDGDWVASEDIVDIPCKGNIQPYIKGSVKNGTQIVLPVVRHIFFSIFIILLKECPLSLIAHLLNYVI